MSAMIGAGKKNLDNTFDGLLMGDLTDAGGGLPTRKVGLYGYDDSILSFALTNDGQAVFGKTGTGQITINGDTGTIKSGNYTQNKTGMLIDMNDGLIEINALTSTDATGKSRATALKISDGTTTLMNVGSGQNTYYLQSSNYPEHIEDGETIARGERGMRINLTNGEIDAAH